MIKKTLHFGSPAYLNVKNGQLVVNYPDKAMGERQVPIEDIGILVLEHQQITITQGCIAALLDNNAAIITCNTSHLPIGLMLPLDGNHIQSERFKYQIEASQPLKKNLWQQTVQAKILNQAAVLYQRNVDCANMLRWADEVRSGDPDNYEGRAAAYYWQNIFPKNITFFRGRNGEPPNNLLNYGYAILRAIVARGLVSSGLLPTLGIYHRNKYNAYCLADDIMEPYRPYVDQLVLQIIDEGKSYEELSTAIKVKLLGITTVDVKFDKGTSPLMVGMQQTTSSLAKCYEGILRKVAYPQMMSFDKPNRYYQFNGDKFSNVAEKEETYLSTDTNDEELPF
jgi:CRISPR-associated protein Cas1